MNKFEKKHKNKSINEKSVKVKNKVKKMKVKDKKNKESNIESNEESMERMDKMLKNEIKEIISDFSKSDSKTNDKSNNNKTNNSLNLKSNKFNKNEFKRNNNSIKRQENSSETQKTPNIRRNRVLLIKTGIKWYEMRVFEENKESDNNMNNNNNKMSRERLNQLRQEAIQLLKDDIDLYQELQEKSSKKEDMNWIQTVLRKGTLADKLSAHTILLQDSPIHNLKSLESIIQMVNTKGKRECIMALDNLRELFIGDLLIPDSKLKTFSELINCFDEKMTDKKARNRQLVLCYFEEQLKNSYRVFIDSLVKVSHDTVDSTKNKALITFFDLLVNNGEQEQYLLENLVNKLGDPLPKLAAQTSHLLNQLINQYHPLMKSVVVGEVERLLYRPNISQRAQYYGLCFLSEVIFSGDDKPLANKLIGIYFGFFKACIKKGDINNKMMSVLLTGVTRAFPYSKLETNVLEEHLQTFYKIIHFVNLNTSIQALMLIFNIIDVNQSGLLTDRFYTVLYRHILEPKLDVCSRKAMFLNLIFRALKRDPILRRVRAFIKRLLQIALTQTSSLASSILILISEIIKSKPALMLSKQINESVSNDVEDDDEEEKYEDMPLSDEELQDLSNGQSNGLEDKCLPKKSGSASWRHSSNVETNRSKCNFYDPNGRNPLYANAELVDLWELHLMRKHFHPSTNLFAEKIVSNTAIDYDGDPLNDFSLKHFLDRFVFRNPKKLSKKSAAKGNQVFGRIQSNDKSLPTINSEEYVNQPENKVPVDERFIYTYLKQRLSSKDDSNDSDIESVTSDDFERMLDHFEPGDKRERNIDFAEHFYENNKNNASKDEEEKDESDDEFDDDMNDEEDDELGFDANDSEFADAFDGIDSELDEALDEANHRLIPKKRKQGFDKMTNDLFASADEFAHLLEQNQSDSDLSDDDQNEDQNDGQSSKRFKKSKTNSKPKKPKFNRRKKKKLNQNLDL